MTDNFIGDAWVVIRPDLSRFEAELMAGVGDALFRVQAGVDAKPIQFKVDAITAPAVAQIAAAQQATTNGNWVVTVTADVAPLIAEIAAAEATVGGKKGGGGGPGLLALFGFGSAAGLFGMAGAFSAASFAGLGFEHVLTTVIGLAGSLAGAIGGGLLLAMGALGVAMVGMGSDMLVMKSAMTNVTAIATAQTAMNDAIAQYGANSAQAVTATKNYNFAISQLPTVLQASTVALATMLNNTKDYWQQATATAQVAAQGIMKQVLSLANTYIPLVAAAAKTNFDIISNAIKPLFAWLAGPQGVGVFKTLESYFKTNLPNSIAAFTQGVEFVLKTFQYLASFTGGWTKAILSFLTYANSPAGFAKWEGIINTLIGMFHTWWNFAKELGKVIYDLFSQSLGLGTSIIQTLTGMLKQLDAWILSSSGKNAVHTLFSVHLQEVLALLGLLPTLLGAFGQLYITIAPPLTLMVTGLATMVGWMVQVPVVGNILAWAGAIWLLSTRLAPLAALLGPAVALLAPLGLLLLSTVAPGLAASAAAMLGLDTALALNPIGLIAGAIILLAAATVLLVLNFKKVSDFLSGPFGTAISVAAAVLMPFIGIPMLIIGHWQAIWSFLHSIPGHFADAFHAVVATGATVVNWFKALPGNIMNFLKALPGNLAKWGQDLLGAAGGLLKGLVGALPNVLKFFIELPLKILALLIGGVAFLLLWGFQIIKNLLGGIAQGAVAVWNWFKALPGTILTIVIHAGTWLLNTGLALLKGLRDGIVNGAVAVWNWMRALPGTILGFLTRLPGLLVALGSGLIHGLWTGITGAITTVWNFFRELPQTILSFLGGLGNLLWNIGYGILKGLWNGMIAVWNDLTGWISGLAGWIASHKGPISVDRMLLYPHGQAIMQGLHDGLKAGIPPILSTLTGLMPAMSGALGGGAGSLSLAGVTASSAAGGGSITQNFHVYGANPADVQAVVRRENATLIRALGARPR